MVSPLAQPSFSRFTHPLFLCSCKYRLTLLGPRLGSLTPLGDRHAEPGPSLLQTRRLPLAGTRLMPVRARLHDSPIVGLAHSALGPDHQKIAKLDRENEVAPPAKVNASVGKVSLRYPTSSMALLIRHMCDRRSKPLVWRSSSRRRISHKRSTRSLRSSRITNPARLSRIPKFSPRWRGSSGSNFVVCIALCPV